MSNDCTNDPASALDNARSILEELGEELQNWLDGLPENLQSSNKASDLEEAISQLESAVSSIEDCPTCAELLEVHYSESTKRKKSRSDRCADACSILSGCADAAREKVSALEDVKGVDPAETDPEVLAKAAKELAQRENDISELESWADACESAQQEAEGVTFPGMFG